MILSRSLFSFILFNILIAHSTLEGCGAINKNTMACVSDLSNILNNLKLSTTPINNFSMGRAFSLSKQELFIISLIVEIFIVCLRTQQGWNYITNDKILSLCYVHEPHYYYNIVLELLFLWMYSFLIYAYIHTTKGYTVIGLKLYTK